MESEDVSLVCIITPISQGTRIYIYGYPIIDKM